MAKSSSNQQCQIVCEMTYNVLMGTLNLTYSPPPQTTSKHWGTTWVQRNKN